MTPGTSTPCATRPSGRDRRRAAHARRTPTTPTGSRRWAPTPVGAVSEGDEMERCAARSSRSVDGPAAYGRRADREVARSRSSRRPATRPTTSASRSATSCFCGDLILGQGSSIVPPAACGGSLADYMALAGRGRGARRRAARPGPRPVDHRPRGEDRRVRRAPPRARAKLVAALESRRALARRAARRGLGRRPRAAAPGGGDGDAGAPGEARGRGPARRRRVD